MPDWVAVSRKAALRVKDALDDQQPGELGRRLERGEGGDVTMVVDRVAEDAIFEVLESVGVPLTAISEERGRVEVAGGGPPFVVIDPIDGSLNAKRRLPFHAVSIAVASGERMSDVEIGYVHDLGTGEEWWAERGGGAFRDGFALARLEPRDALEIVGIETARPDLIGEHAKQIAELPVSRIRAFGSVALSLCHVAAGALDGMASLRAIRSVDAAAGQLLVTEVGGVVEFPDAERDPSLGLEMRSRVVAAGPAGVGGLLGL